MVSDHGLRRGQTMGSPETVKQELRTSGLEIVLLGRGLPVQWGVGKTMHGPPKLSG